jgi:crotonobetainyl-CoA:carnitine CoA-transferase CaiB-like acyl-CoA transferase
MPGNPIKMGQEEVFEPAPTLGQHNQEVLGGLLGRSDAELKSLQEKGII